MDSQFSSDASASLSLRKCFPLDVIVDLYSPVAVVVSDSMAAAGGHGHVVQTVGERLATLRLPYRGRSWCGSSRSTCISKRVVGRRCRQNS